MKFLILSVLLIGLIGLHLCNSSVVERRLREGNNGIQRKTRGCGMICSFKINFNKKNRGQQTCYQLPNQNNATISECVYNCLLLRGENLANATQCICIDERCVAPLNASTSSPWIFTIFPFSTTALPSSSSSSSASTTSSTTTSTTTAQP